MLTQRQKQLLSLVVQEYTDTGIPISSKALAKEYGLSSSTATLRAEFARLCEMGYLSQPHTSAGRVPTDKGYRFFIKNLMTPHGIPQKDKAEIRKNLSRKTLPLEKNIARTISSSTHNLGLYFEPRTGLLYKEGFPEVFKRPDFAAIEQVFDFVELLEIFENHIFEFLKNALWDEREPTILIGRSNFFPLQDDYSILYSGYETGGYDHMIGMLGPKRMDYARNLAILDFIRDELMQREK